VALLADWPSWWALELDSKPSTALDHSRISLDHYRPLFEAGVACDVVPPQRELSGYRLVVAPNLYLLTTSDARRLAAYVRAGGRLLVSFFSGIVDEHDRVHPGGYPAPLRELLGLRVEEFWPLDAGRSVTVGDGALTGRADLWSEDITLEGAEALARFTGGDLAGRPAVTRHAYGQGTVWYVGTRLDAALMRALLDDVRAAAGVAPVLPGLPEGVQATVREGPGGRYVFLLNHGSRTVEVELPAPMHDALAAADGTDEDGGRGEGGARAGAVGRITLDARGVAVLTGA
jgi:beta-galactosidase